MRNFITIEALVVEMERDPAMAKHLRAARRRLAPVLYRRGSANFKRMMRGESPSKRGR